MSDRDTNPHLRAKNSQTMKDQGEKTRRMREEEIKPLEEAIRSGMYQRDPYKVAEKIIQAHLIKPE